jgi:hypothetical protein
MNQSHQAHKGSPLRWILGGGIVLIIAIGVALAAFLPLWVVQWLGGKDFQKLASQQVSSLLHTEGDFQSLEWSSFSVYTPEFKSRPGARGPWNFRTSIGAQAERFTNYISKIIDYSV